MFGLSYLLVKNYFTDKLRTIVSANITSLPGCGVLITVSCLFYVLWIFVNFVV